MRADTKSASSRIRLTEPLAGKVAETGRRQDFSDESHPSPRDSVVIAVVRFWTFAGELDAHEAELPERRKRGEAALDVMENHLSGYQFFVGNRYSIADIALYAYTHVAHEGGFDLSNRPNLTAWLARVASQPGAVAIDDVES